MEGGAKCFGEALSKEKMEEGASGCFGKALSQGKVGAQQHNEKVTRQSQMPEEPPEKEQSEDIEWLSSLSHSQLDMLISLKELAILRAKNAGYEEVAEKFGPRMLRALGAILMEYLKERIQNMSIFPDSSEGLELLSDDQFASQKHVKDSCQVALVEIIKSSSRTTRKRLLESETGSQSCKKPRVEDSSW